MFLGPCFAAFGQRLVVDEARAAQGASQQLFLLRRRVEAVFVCTLHVPGLAHICIMPIQNARGKEWEHYTPPKKAVSPPCKTPYIPMAKARGLTANPIKPIRPVRERFPGTRATAFLVSRPTGCGNGLGGAWGFSPRDPCHASCCSMRVHRRHGCRDPARVAGSTVDCAGISLRIACACFRGPTGRGDSPRNCPVRVRIPAKAPAEAMASTPPDPVRTSAGTGTMPR